MLLLGLASGTGVCYHSRMGPAAAALAALLALGSPTGDEALRIGHKLWVNEAGGKVAPLTHWNRGEAFASLGIGHFIWYPAGREGPYTESFPALLEFLDSRGVAVPSWLWGPCPWPDRDSFYADFTSRKMVQLRSFLRGTVDYQARFAAQRLTKSLPKLLESAPADRRDFIAGQFARVAKAEGGLYALVDYVNFKGEGVAPGERYQGVGWGLLQVLDGMDPAAADPMNEFSDSAARVLTRRVRLAPPGKADARWLEVWLKRVRTYRTPA